MAYSHGAAMTHSSRITKVLGVIVRRMSLVSDNSTMKVDLPRPISSDATIFLSASRTWSLHRSSPPIRLTGILAALAERLHNSRLHSIVDPQADRSCRYKGPYLSHANDQGLRSSHQPVLILDLIRRFTVARTQELLPAWISTMSLSLGDLSHRPYSVP